MFLAAVGINNCLQNEHDGVFLLSFFGYLLVGTGSTLFHTTLKYPMQLLDELSMIYTTCIMIYASFSPGRSRTFTRGLAIFLVGLSTFITLYYHYLQDPSFHQVAYTILTAVVLFHSMYMMETRLRPSLTSAKSEQEKQEAAFATGGDEPTALEEYRKKTRRLNEMWCLIGCGLGIFLGGFVMWTIDNEFCSTLRIWRRSLGMPWGLLLEGHGWW